MAETAVSAAQRVQDVTRFIDRNLGEPLTLVKMAAALKLNPYHFAHVFKQASGLAPHQYVIQRRLARAKQLLGTTNLPIAEVALAVGCASQSHFSALFHRPTGMTPLTYRLRTRPRRSLPPQVCDIPPAKRRASLPKAESFRRRLNSRGWRAGWMGE